nr:ABC transporter ATP-binding protein [uncultured Treponema sp.]
MQETKRSMEPAEYHFDTKKPVQTLFRLFTAEKANLVYSAVFFLIKNSPVWVLPIVTAHIINCVSAALQQPETKPEQMHSIVIALAVFAVFAVQNIATHTIFIYFLAKSIRSIEAKMRLSIIRRLQQLSVAFHDKTAAGVIQSKVLRDVESIRNVIMIGMNLYLPAITSIILAFAMTLRKAPVISLLYLVCVPLVLVIMRVFRRRMDSTNSMLRRDMEKMTAEITEMLAMLPVTKAHGLEKTEEEKLQKDFQIVFKNGLRLDIVSALFGSTNWVAFQLLQIGCLAVTVPFAFAGKIGTGDIILYQGFFNMVLNSVATVINMYPDIMRGIDAVRSIGEILECDEIERNEGKPAMPAVTGDVCFSHVQFSYPDAALHALNDVSFTVKAGESVAFVGESGSGKSTVMQLVLGLRQPQAGTVTVDGIDLSTVDLRSYRQFISVVPQSVVLFSGSVLQNISYGLPHVTEAQVREAARLANALEFIEKLPDGFHTMLGESGARLSGGQRQRIAIARALIRDPHILIFDEATSALDVVSEKLVQEAIDTVIRGRTCFIVAHRLSTVRNVDRIFVLKDGRIIEEGSYDALVAAGGDFARLRALQ